MPNYKYYDKIAEETTTTGLDEAVFAGAIPAHHTFAERLTDGDLITVVMYAVNAAGNPTGDWEVSSGLYNAAANKVLRSTKHASSNGGAAVNFAAGTKRVRLCHWSDKALLPKIDIYTADANWTKPHGCTMVEVYLIAQGGGGGAGGRGPAGNIRRAGGAGGSSPITRALFAAADLAATEAIIVGNSVNGAASQTVDSTDGANGTAGEATSFGDWLYAPGANGGVGGGFNNTGGTGATAAGVTSHFQQAGNAGNTSSTTGAAGPGMGNSTTGVPGAGNAGGGLTSGNVASAGGGGSGIALGLVINTTAGGTAGTSGGGAGGTGNAAPWLYGITLGTGGGGGGSSTPGAAGRGGNGGNYGGGGGGGGASLNGNASGGGGDGGPGVCVVISW